MEPCWILPTRFRPPQSKSFSNCKKKGVRLILASGRSYTRLLPYARELEMEKYNGLLIEVDGIAWYDLSTGKRHVLKKMKPEEIASIFQYLMNMECETMACFDDGLFDFFPQSLKTVKEAIRQDQHLPNRLSLDRRSVELACRHARRLSQHQIHSSRRGDHGSHQQTANHAGRGAAARDLRRFEAKNTATSSRFFERRPDSSKCCPTASPKERLCCI